MKRVRTSLFFAAVLGVLALCGSAWGVESSESIQGLISHWKFDEGQGSIAYDSVGNNDGTVYGAVWTTGQVNGALSFDGLDDYVDVGNDSSLKPPLPVTLSAWIRLSSLASPQVIVALDDHSIGRYGIGFFVMHENNLQISYADGGSPGPASRRTKNGATALSANTWYHVAAVLRGPRDMDIYINGVDDGGTYSGTGGSLTYSASGHSFIGSDAAVRSYLNGKIDEVAIYNRALSAEEIQQLYQGEFADLVGLEIVGPDEVAENFSASYKAIANYDNDSTRDVTDSALWTVEPNTAANIDDYGVLTTQDIVKHEPATILAGYTEGDVTVEAEKAIDILAICPTGTALRLDGVDDYVDFSRNIITTTEFTLAAWANHYGLGGGSANTNPIFQQRDDDARVATAKSIIVLHTEHTGDDPNAFAYVRSSSGPSQILTYPKKNYNEWHHYAITVDSDDLVFYIDGVEVDKTSNIQTGDYVTSIDYVEIGRHRCNGITRGFFNGAIDEVAIYNRALSAEEIRTNMHTRLAGDEPNLVGYWDFDEGEGQIVYDLSGNGNDGQLGSTPEADSSDPAWVKSYAPVGICTLYQIATKAAERALGLKLEMLEELLGTLAEEWTAYEALEELLESGDYGDLNKGDIVTAKQKIHSAIQHQEQAIDALEKSIEKLEDALSALGYEPEPPVPNQPPNVNITKPTEGAVFTPSETIEIEANAWDVEGSVVKVEFFANGSKTGEDNDGTDGWKTNWYDHPSGTYSLTAKATDNDGAATTSPAVGIIVHGAPPPPPPPGPPPPPPPEPPPPPGSPPV